MKKVLLLVAVFLIGNATQTLANQNSDVVINPGKKHRYYKSQTIRFVENGVLYSVATDGTFNFRFLNRRGNYTYGRRGHQSNYIPASYNGVQYARANRYRSQIRTDRFGNIVRVGRTWIEYNRSGRVKWIGNVRLRYDRGLLVRIGGMYIDYNRNGRIRNTFGHINRENRQVWHDDWNTCNNRSHDHYKYDRLDFPHEEYGDRIRGKEIK